MNLSAPIGFLVGLGVVAFAIAADSKNLNIFLDVHALVIVIGGTAAAAMVCIPFRQLFSMAKVFVKTVSGAQKEQIEKSIEEVVGISTSIHNGSTIEAEIQKVKNPFLKESLSLLIEGGLDDDEFEDILEMRVEQQNERYKREGATYRIIGKFPPAFGLIGATLGMIALLQGLGEPDAFNRLGPAMSVALVATFYGLILANVFIIPIGEHIMHASEDDLTMRRIVLDGVKLIRDSKHPLLVEEHLKSYLTPHERNQLKKAG